MASMSRCFLVLAFLFVASSCEATSWIDGSSQLIHKVCKITIDYKFCLHALSADPSYMSADLTGLGYISINLTKDHIGNTSPVIKELIKHANESKTRNCLADCSSFYANAKDSASDATSALRAKDYMKMNLDVSAVIDEGATCEDGFTEAGVPSPLTRENESLQRLGGIAAAISNMLAGKLA